MLASMYLLSANVFLCVLPRIMGVNDRLCARQTFEWQTAWQVCVHLLQVSDTPSPHPGSEGTFLPRLYRFVLHPLCMVAG